MAANPLERKSRNSFLLGIVVTLLITGCIIAFLLVQLVGINKKRQEERALLQTVYALNVDVKSGQIITKDMIDVLTVSSTAIPANAISDVETLANYSLTDAEGKDVYTDARGLFIKRNSEYLEVYEGEQSTYYTYSPEGEKQNVTLSTREKENIKTDEYGKYVVRETEQKTRIYKEENTDNYYILKINYYGTDVNKENPVREKEYIQLNGSALIAKLDMKMNTVVTLEMIAKSDERITDDVRKQEYNCVVLPLDLETGDYVDFRLLLPNGQDYIVVSKKQVTLATAEDPNPEVGTLWTSSDTIWVNLREDEILSMSCAIVDAYKISGAKLYATVYKDPGMQRPATPTYLVNAETAALLQKDPNILSEALTELRSRYNGSDRNTHIDTQIMKQEDPEGNFIDKMEESITNTTDQRLEYLESLGK
ncbi:MAG: hypothetical protein HFJ48_04505 [Clostridia bacterium]|nr:hypothetical protein [Clostridia bacterium]